MPRWKWASQTGTTGTRESRRWRTHGERYGSARTSPAVLGGALVAVVALVAFGVRQTRSAVPMVDLRLYRDRRFSGASFAVAVMTVATGSTLFILSQYLQLVLGYSAFETGLA